ncbi:MAG: ABC transporter ATP-binding protein/permease [Propionibacteriaceae bacterium]|jgi:ATP-binding cassette subfamily B protein|nr:ABC transporter ATP-binding protein/permease [Propionibacteriaceae bacterium]
MADVQTRRAELREDAKAAAGKGQPGMGRLWELAMTRPALVVAACLLNVLSVAAGFTPFVACYFIIVDLVAHAGDLAGLDSGRLTSLGWLAAGGAVAAVLLNAAALGCSHWAAFTTLYKLKLRFLGHLASLSLGFHTANPSGKLRKVVDENIEKLEGFIAHQLPDLAGSVAMPLITVGILFAFDWRLGAASLVPIAAAYLIQMSAFGNKAAQAFMANYQNSLEEMNNAAVEYVRGISVVKAFNQTVYSFRRFHQTIVTYGRFCLDYTMAFERHMILFVVIINHVYLVLMPVVIFLSGGADDYPAFALAVIFYLVFSLSLPTPFMKLLYVSQTGRQIADGVERMDRILAVEPLPEPAQPKEADGCRVEFDQVRFSYGPDAEAALDGVTFTAEPGEITALVGPSGGGKSTIAHLLCRFYDVDAGAIRIGGADVREMAGDHLMSQVSFVFQDVFLFQQSVAANIAIGHPRASREQIIAAARAAQCHDFIERLPDGYDTVIGSSGIHLSGGERQRLVIARALLKDAPILVLDEATAFADPENEHRIHLAFAELMRGKTTLIIAHRLSTVRGADRIVVIDQGRVVQQGVHDELAAAPGRYQSMWRTYQETLSWRIETKEAGRV